MPLRRFNLYATSIALHSKGTCARTTPLRDAFLKAIDEDSGERMKTDTRAVVVDVPQALAFAPVRRIGARAAARANGFDTDRLAMTRQTSTSAR